MSGRHKLTILQINDTHAYLDEHWELFRDGAEVRHEVVSLANGRLQADNENLMNSSQPLFQIGESNDEY